MADFPPGFLPVDPNAWGATPAAPSADVPPADALRKGEFPPGFEPVPDSTTGADEGQWRGSSILPFETNETTKGVRFNPMGSQVVKDIVDAVMLPGRVAKGEIEPTMQDIINAAGLYSPAGVATNIKRNIPKPVARALKSDGLTPDMVRGRLDDIGPNAVVGDLGPNLRAQTAGVATTPGVGQKTIVDKLTARKAGGPGRIRTALDDTLGPAPIPSEVTAGLKEQGKRLSPQYETVLKDAAKVDTTPLAATLDETIAGPVRGDAMTAVQKVRSMLNRKPPPVDDPAAAIAAAPPAQQAELARRHLAGEPLTVSTVLDDNPATLHAIRKEVDKMINKDPALASTLTPIRKQIDDMLAAAAPGVKELDLKHQGLKKEGAAFERGQTVLDSGRTSPRPAELQAEVNKAQGPYGTEFGPSNEVARLSQGARAEIDRVVGTNLNDRAAMNSLLKGEGDWNYDRLVTLFGKDKTDRIYKVLENERIMAETENLALAGSKTGAVTKAQEEVSMSPAGPGPLQSAGDLKFGTAARRLKDKIMGGAAERRQSAQNADVADALMKPGIDTSVGSRPFTPVPELIQTIMRDKEEEARRKNVARGVQAHHDRVY